MFWLGNIDFFSNSMSSSNDVHSTLSYFSFQPACFRRPFFLLSVDVVIVNITLIVIGVDDEQYRQAHYFRTILDESRMTIIRLKKTY